MSGSNGSIATNSFDHVALWVSERDAIASFLCDHLGMHEIDRTDRFTLVGADAREGKVTLFDAPGPRDPGLLERIVLRVSDLDRAVAALPGDVAVERDGGEARFEGPERLGLGLVQADAAPLEYDLDHVVLRVGDPDAAYDQLQGLGFDGDDGRLRVADRHLRLEPGDGLDGAGPPLLNHLALLVDSASAVETEVRRRGLEVADVVDAANTIAVFLDGPGGIRLEYVEHKPTFSLV